MSTGRTPTNPKNGGKIPSDSDTAIKVATSGGTVIGQLGFGWLADVVGRKRMYGLELILIIFATLAQALSSDSPSISIVGLIIFWRVLMGIGVSLLRRRKAVPILTILFLSLRRQWHMLTAVHRLAVTTLFPRLSLQSTFHLNLTLSSLSNLTSRFATTKWRGAMMGAVFAMQGIGQFTAAIIALIAVSGFHNSLKTAATVDLCDGVCQVAVDKTWRIIIGFGAVPGCIALYFRLTIPETPRYTFDVARDSEKAVEDVKAYHSGKREGKPDEVSRAAVLQDSRTRLDPPKASWGDFIHHYGQWRHGKVLLGTAGSWFFLGKFLSATVYLLELHN